MPDILASLRMVASFIDEIPGVYVPQEDLETTIADLAVRTVAIAGSTLFVATIIAILFSKRYPVLKLPLFVVMATAMAGSSLVLIGSTVYLNTRADSGGPVHWHADIEFWACGNELEFRDPTGFLSNKIGTSVLHEHDDHRIHLEGVVVDDEVDASLGKFMHVAGGAITAQQMVVPLNDADRGDIFEDKEDGDGPAVTDPDAVEPYIIDDAELGKVAYFQDGDTCNDTVSDVQVFVYQYNGEDKTYEQIKLENPRDYVIYDDPNVPPGDCIIFEFGPEREKTDKLCDQYGIRDIERCEQFGVIPSQRAICELTQVNYSAADSIPINSVNFDESEVLDTDAESPPESESSQSEVPLSDTEQQQLDESVVTTIHQDPALEQARLDCIESGDDFGPECEAYNASVEASPEAQAELEAPFLDGGVIIEEES